MELFVDFYISTGDQGPGKDGHSQKDFEHFSNIYIYIFILQHAQCNKPRGSFKHMFFVFFPGGRPAI